MTRVRLLLTLAVAFTVLCRAIAADGDFVAIPIDETADATEHASATTQTFETIAARVAQTAQARQAEAAAALNATRTRIAAEQVPLLEQMRAVEARIFETERAVRQTKTGADNAGAEKRRLIKELDTLRKMTGFANTVAHDSLKAIAESLAPGEPRATAESMEALLARMQDAERGPSAALAMDAVDLMIDRVEHSLGGSRVAGQAISASTNRVLAGTFAFAGPEVFFRADDGSEAGTVRVRDGSAVPVVHPLPGWLSADAEAYFAGRDGALPLDPSGGKALRLSETRGTLSMHIKKGGLVAYGILVVGAVALLMILQKVRDLWRMETDTPAAIETFLAAVARGDIAEAERLAAGFRPTTRTLFEAGLRHRHETKSLLEEHLESVLLELKIHFERRLPMLAVIATAAPLMGLFGTVVGMVKTFALITVFGTGNAGKLSSGISEVLVATELGLAVAIPTLIAHGFLAHRFEKNLSQLERCALKFVIALETARARRTEMPAPALVTT